MPVCSSLRLTVKLVKLYIWGEGAGSRHHCGGLPCARPRQGRRAPCPAVRWRPPSATPVRGQGSGSAWPETRLPGTCALPLAPRARGWLPGVPGANGGRGTRPGGLASSPSPVPSPMVHLHRWPEGPARSPQRGVEWAQPLHP